MRRYIWLVAGAVLFLAAGWLTSGVPSPDDELARPRVSFPRMTSKRYKLNRKRKTLKLKQVKTRGETQITTTHARDPMHVALAGSKRNVVVEASAIMHSPVGRLLLDCFGRQDLKKLEKKTGVNVERDLDRVSFGDGDTIMASGHFANFKPPEGTMESYGPDARIQTSDGSENDREVVGVWRDEFVVMGTRDEVRTTLDRLQGGTVPEGRMLDPSSAYGEAYGYVGKELLLELLPENNGLDDLIKTAVDDVELHLDTQRDVAMAFQVRGKNADKLDEAARAIGGGLALARVSARAEGKKRLEELLEQARVVRQGKGQFRLEFAVSYEFFERELAGCKGRQL